VHVLGLERGGSFAIGSINLRAHLVSLCSSVRMLIYWEIETVTVVLDLGIETRELILLLCVQACAYLFTDFYANSVPK
jgi:hypothetical protein